MARISHEPSTLVYTLLDNSVIDFDDFYLIVRDLHTFMVNEFVPNSEANTVHVKLAYQASLVNSQTKLTQRYPLLSSVVLISKLSNFVKECELSHLDQLRQQFGGSGGHVPPAPKATRGRGRKFPQRTAPYSRPVPPKSVPPPQPEQQQETQPAYDDSPCYPDYE